MVDNNRLCVCGGKCEDCGKCNLYEGTTRKERLLSLPDWFVPDPCPNEDSERKWHGIAFDVGTTTVVGILWDLKINKIVDTIGRTNPQSAFGADVISRITYASASPENLMVMRGKIIGCMNDILDEFYEKHSINRYSVVKSTIVGNTTMSHLVLGLNPASLAKAPFEPMFTGPIIQKSQELGLKINPEAEVLILPNIAGHVGSDIVGVIIASGIVNQEGYNLVIDIGTNGEIVISGNGKMFTCSTAAGPAFEGSRIKQGMRAIDGAIEGVSIRKGNVGIKTIGDKPAIGICGSGLIDAIAQMLEAGLINFKGNLVSHDEAEKNGIDEKLVARLRNGENGNEFVLSFKKDDRAQDIALNQKDIREVQLAKGAIFAGIQILLKGINIESDKLDKIMLAGAFGSYIKGKNALKIGLLPKIEPSKIIHIGNAAGVGACMALLSEKSRKEAVKRAKEVIHVELALHPEFEKEFLQGMYFPKE